MNDTLNHPAIQSISLYPFTSNAVGRSAVTTSSVATLLAISHSIEQTVSRHALDGIFYAGFQRFSAFLPQVNRFRFLASRCKKVYVFGFPDAAVPQIDNLEYVSLDAEAPLVREWFIVFQSNSFSAGLLTRQVGDDMHHKFGRGRLYQGLLTLEDEVITPLAQLISNSLNLTDTDTEAIYVPRPFSTYLQEFSGYMERAQSQLTNLYQNLSSRTAALERMETIVKSMMSRHAWDDAIFNLNAPEPQPEHSKRTLSIMFTDIQNFTALFNSVNVGELTNLLNKYFNIVTTVIYQHHGDIDKFLGDGMLAFFQNPHDALSAAIELQSRLAYFNNQNAVHLEIQLNTRLGISTGECIIARIGSDDRRETTLIGDPVNISSRLQTYSPANGIALDEATYISAGMSFQLQGRDVNVKGKGMQRIYTAEFEELNALKKNFNPN